MRVFHLPCLTLGLCLLAGAHRDATAQAAPPETITIDGDDEERVAFPIEISCTDPRSQKRDLGHPPICY